jgi:hypothetical protein
VSLAKAATFCLLFVTLGNFQLWGATVTTLNTSNTALGVNLVVGDAKTTTITGAAPNAPVSVHAFNNGADVGSATVGTTNAQGGFTVTGHAVAGSIGSHMDIWSVSGAEVGRMEYQVIDKPTSLGVLSVGLAPVQCASGRTGA